MSERPRSRHQESVRGGAAALDHETVAQRLQLWFSPSLPTGAFSHGHGIESAIADGDIGDAGQLQAWLHSVLTRGAARNDAILIAAAWRCVASAPANAHRPAGDDLDELDELARALCAGAERLSETLSQGRAFVDATAAWPPPTGSTSPPDGSTLRNLSLPVVIGAVSARHRLPLKATLIAALQGGIGNLAWIAARLLPLGQQATLRILAALEPRIRDVATCAIDAELQDIGSAVPLADIASLRHERLHSRVCHT